MTQEEKDLLLKDLCTRLPYGVKIKTSYDRIKEPIRLLSINPKEDTFTIGGKFTTISGLELDLYDCKPYLFPLSSMTKEQRNKLEYNFSIVLTRHDNLFFQDGCVIHEDCYLLIDWLIANHFDYRGLIPMGLAIDCTNLNIY